MKELSPDIVQKYLDGTASRVESAIVDAWFQSLISEGSAVQNLQSEEAENVARKMWNAIAEAIEKKSRVQDLDDSI